MPKKIKITSTLVAATDGADTIHGSNKADTPDVIDAGAGDDLVKTYQGADTVAGGAGADRFIIDWPDSNAQPGFGVDRITDFNGAEGDKIDLSFTRHYSAADLAVAVTRPLNAGDVTLTPNGGGMTHVRVEVVAGDHRWDIDVDVVGTITLDDFIF